MRVGLCGQSEGSGRHLQLSFCPLQPFPLPEGFIETLVPRASSGAEGGAGAGRPLSRDGAETTSPGPGLAWGGGGGRWGGQDYA
jgi:hypothetical protein